MDFTLIYPGPRFQGAGYEASCARHGITVDAARFEAAVAGAAAVLDSADELYDPDLFVRYTHRIIELMGGASPHARQAARELYEEWAAHHHFSLYEDVVETLQTLHDRQVRIGLISNSNRCLASFQSHFALDGLITVSVSSSALRRMKPHPDIFRAALTLMDVPASEAAMVGDSLRHDVEGARRVGMQGVLIARGGRPAGVGADVIVLESLRELPDRLET